LISQGDAIGLGYGAPSARGAVQNVNEQVLNVEIFHGVLVLL